jgi:hypothetical protein
MQFNDLPTVKWNESMLERNRCLVDGEEQPLFIGKIIKMMREGTQPRILLLADPGHGKTWAAGRLAEKLHDELGVLEEEYDPDYQMTMDPLAWSQRIRSSRKKMFFMPDVDAVLPSDEYHTAKNKTNRQLVYLSRRFSNPIGWDGHELSKCPKAVRTNHNIKLVARGNGNEYKFKVVRVLRENDSQTEEIEEKPLGFWKPKKPSKKTRERIEELDEKRKEEKIIEGEDKMKLERKKEEIKKKAFS